MHEEKIKKGKQYKEFYTKKLYIKSTELIANFTLIYILNVHIYNLSEEEEMISLIPKSTSLSFNHSMLSKKVAASKD